MNIKALGVAASLAVLSISAVQAGPVLDAVKARGHVVCGVNTAAPGFSNADSKGEWKGLDVDICLLVFDGIKQRAAAALAGKQHAAPVVGVKNCVALPLTQKIVFLGGDVVAHAFVVV